MKELFDNESQTYKSLLKIILSVIIITIIIDTANEYKTNHNSFFFYKDIINLVFILLSLALCYFNYIKNTTLLVLAFYSILLSITVSLPYRIESHHHFESYFLKTELIFLIITFATGALIKPIHMLICIALNFIFIISSYIVNNEGYPIEKYLFYTSLTLGTSYAGYKVHNYFINLQKKIEEKKEIIHYKNLELEQLIHSKNELIKIIGHDIKTPFSQLIMLTDLLEKTQNQEEKKQFNILMKEAATNGITIIEGLVHWSQNLNNELHSKKEFNLYHLVENVILQNKLNLSKKNIIIENKNDDKTKVYHNETLIETVLRNFLTNSIKFSHNHSKIIITYTIKNNTLNISIQDFGTGMSKETIKKIVANEKTTPAFGTLNEKGQGYGLSFCYRMIKQNNGTLSLKSKPNKGTLASFKLPL